jgi:hypothetical protein
MWTDAAFLFTLAAGGTAVRSPAVLSPLRARRYGPTLVSEDSTRPTNCPVCGEAVFFIRHNGESVWVDDLGSPWPKHGCFDEPYESKSEFAIWSAKASGLTNPKMGILTRILGPTSKEGPGVEIRMHNSTRLSVELRWIPDMSLIRGSLVAVSREDNMIIVSGYGEIPLSMVIKHPAPENGWGMCSRCYTWVHDDHCRRRGVQKAASNSNIKPSERKRRHD